MADGYLNKCKSCAKRDVRKNRSEKAGQYQEYERSRANLPRRVAARKAYAATDRGKEAFRRARLATWARHPERRKANMALGNAVRDGRVVKPVACLYCGSDYRVQGHHASYAPDMRLAVTWLCQACHKQVHEETERYNRQAFA